MKRKYLQYSVLVKGAYGGFNFGDDALMIAINELLRMMYTNEQFVYYCHNRDYLNKLIPGLNVLEPNSGNTVFANICLYGGGTQFFNFSSSFLGTAKAIIRDILKQVSMCIPSVRRKNQNIENYKIMAAIGLGIGPFNNKYSKFKVNKLFKKMSFVAVRDIKSYEMCISGSIANSFLRSDLCYWPGFVDKYVAKNSVQISRKVSRVGVIVRDWPWDKKGDGYVENLLSVVRLLKAKGIDIEFILFAGCKDKIWENRIASLEIKHAEWNPKVNSVEDFIKYLSTFDMFITSRYHGGVFASLLSKPCICIGIEQKLEMLADLLGEGGKLWEYPFRINDCVQMFEDISNTYPQAVESIKLSVERQKLIAREMVDDFVQFCAKI